MELEISASLLLFLHSLGSHCFFGQHLEYNACEATNMQRYDLGMNTKQTSLRALTCNGMHRFAPAQHPCGAGQGNQNTDEHDSPKRVAPWNYPTQKSAEYRICTSLQEDDEHNSISFRTLRGNRAWGLLARYRASEKRSGASAGVLSSVVHKTAYYGQVEIGTPRLERLAASPALTFLLIAFIRPTSLRVLGTDYSIIICSVICCSFDIVVNA
eukprot:5618835-Amphidinium_carterae.1